MYNVNTKGHLTSLWSANHRIRPAHKQTKSTDLRCQMRQRIRRIHYSPRTEKTHQYGDKFCGLLKRLSACRRAAPMVLQT